MLAVLASGALTYTIIEAQPSGWTSAATAGRGALSIVLLAAFVAWEAHVPYPMMPLRLFRDPRFAVASGAVAILFFGLAGVTFMLTQIYQFVLGYSPFAAGVRSLPSAVALTLAVPAGYQAGAARAGLNVAVASGLLAMSAGLGYLALATGRTTYPHYLIAATVMAVGTGLTTAPATQSVLSCLTPASFGVGSAVNNTTRNLGSVLGVAALGSLAATAYARGARGAGRGGARVRPRREHRGPGHRGAHRRHRSSRRPVPARLPAGPDLARPRGQGPGHQLMTAIRSPSWMTSPSATCILVSTPGPSARTGISIFIDSKITRVSPSST